MMLTETTTMIHYHHSDGGMSRMEKARFLTGRHALVSYMYPSEIGVAAEVCQSFILDNGAYTAWTQGVPVDFDGFLRWCYEWHRHPGFDWVLIPDVIEGSEQDNDDLIAAWPADIRGVPVWHMDERITRLERLCARYDYVAIGASGIWSSPGESGWWSRIGQAMDAICDSGGRPPCRLHLLRCLDQRIFSRLPVSSADSMSAVRRASTMLHLFGAYVPPTASQRAEVWAARAEAHNSAPVWQRIDQHELFRDVA